MEKEIEALLEPNKRAVIFLQKAAMVGSIINIFIGALFLLCWQLNIFTDSFLVHTVAINPLAAIGFITAGGGLYLQLLNIYKKNLWKTLPSILLTCITLFIGITTTIHFLFGFHISMDHIFFGDRLKDNSISPNTGVNFLLIGIALVFLQFPFIKYFVRIGQMLTLLAATITMLAVIGYMYRTLPLYQITYLTPMPISSALTFTILSIAILAGTCNYGVVKILTKNIPSSILALRLIVITLTLPAAIGYLLLVAVEFNFIDAQTGIAILVVVTTLLFSTMIWINTRLLQRSELENLLIKHQLQNENIKLKIDSEKLAAKAIELEEKKEEAYENLLRSNFYHPPKPVM